VTEGPGHSAYSIHSTYEVRQRAIEAVNRGMEVSLVARVFGTDRATIHRWLQRYRLQGESGLSRRPGSGRPRILEALTEYELRRVILRPATDFGYETDLWSIKRVQAILEDRYDLQISKDTVWRRLREAGLTYQKPERQYYELDDRARQAWARREIPRIRRAVLEFRAILYFQDEANVSLTAFLGKTWGVRGHTPKVRVTGARGGVAAMSAISRRGFLLFRIYEKRITSVEVIEFLDQMLHHHRTRHLVVVMDQAPPHVSKATTHFIESQRRLHVFYLPKYSPDWNPDEKVWNHLKHQELKAHRAKTKAELKDLTKEKLRSMSRDPELVRGIFFRCCVADLFG
jgi:transposase